MKKFCLTSRDCFVRANFLLPSFRVFCGCLAMTVLLVIFFSSCSSPSGDVEKENINYDSSKVSSTPQLNNSLSDQFDTIAKPSDDLKKFLAKAKKLNFIPDDTAHKFTTSDHKKYFGMINVPKEFAEYQRLAMAKAKNTCLNLVKKNVHIKVEEWIFENDADAKQIDDALSAPLEDKRSERFARFPLTFWRVHDRMYYVHTDAEENRAEMDKVSNLLVRVLSPDQ